ncbi:MAG: putative metal-binding motif-containing protein [Myxococcota bacterium]
MRRFQFWLVSGGFALLSLVAVTLVVVGQRTTPAEPGLVKRPGGDEHWAVPFGDEFWSFEAGSPVERVSHAFRETGEYSVARSRLYELRASSDQLEVESGFGKPLRWSARSVWLDGKELDCSSTGETQVLGDTWQRRMRCGGAELVEHVRAKNDGVHFSWIFPRPIAGKAGLTLRTESMGFTHHATTKRGHHLVNKSGGMFRIGKATLVDSKGESTPLETRAEGSKIAIHVPATALADAAYPVSVDPIVEPEVDIDAPLAVEMDGTTYPAVAHSDDQSLVIWIDFLHGSSWRVMAARIHDDGTLLDPDGIEISNGPGRARFPSVASDGEDYLVTWADENGPTRRVFARRVSGLTGETLDASPVMLSSVAGWRFHTSAAFGGGVYAIAWMGDASPHETYITRISQAGVILDPTPISLASVSSGSTWRPAIRYGTDRFVVAFARWGSTNSMRTRSLFPDGTVGTSEYTLGNFAQKPDWLGLNFDGTTFLPVWRMVSGAVEELWARKLNDSGAPTGSNARLLSSVKQACPGSTGAGHSVLWTMPNGSVEIAPVSGLTLGTAIGLSATADTGFPGPVLVKTSTGGLAVWRRPGTKELAGIRLTPSNTANGSEFVISTRANYESMPAVTSNGSNYLLAWVDDRWGDSDILATRVGPTGTVLDPSGLLAAVPGTNDTAPAIASDGTDYLLAYITESGGTYDVSALKIASDGTVDTSLGNLTSDSTAQNAPAVASSSGGYAVTYEHGASDIYALTVSSTGVVSAPIPVSTASGAQTAPAIAGNASGYLITHESGGAVYSARLDSAGIVLDASPGVSVVTSNAQHPSVATDGSAFLVGWEDSRAAHPQIYASRVSPAGAVLDPSGILVASDSFADLVRPRVAFRSGYMANWLDSANGTVRAQYLDTTASLVGTNFTVVSTHGVVASGHSLSGGVGEEFISAYQLFDSSGYSTSQVRFRVISMDPDNDGFGAFASDCDDSDPLIFPGALEQCDSVDSDCDGSSVDEFFDNDADGIPDCVDTDDDNDGIADGSDPCPFIAGLTTCSNDTDGDGIVDGDETLVARFDPNTGPAGSTELCDGKDNNGNGQIDEGTGCNQCD